MRVIGSGKFVSIAASNTQMNQMFTSELSGITFGVGSAKYCQVSSKYEAEQGIVTGTALCFEPGADRLYIGFENQPIIQVNGYTAYTGNVTFVTDAWVNESTGKAGWATKEFQFRSGLLTN